MRLILSFLILCFSVQAFAQVPVYFWDNQEKLVQANSGCYIETISEQRFRISNYHGSKKLSYENLRNYDGAKQSYLPNGSLVKIIEGKEKSKYSKVEIAGIQKNIKNNRWYTSRGDQGYLFYRSLEAIEDFVLKVDSQKIKGFEQTLLANESHSYWHAAVGKTYYQLKCPELNKTRNYILFKVYKKGSLSPDMLVAVYHDETAVFKKLETISKYDVVDILPKLLAENQATNFVDLAIQNGATEELITNQNSPERIHRETFSIMPVDKGINDVVCVANSTLNARNSQLDRVLFKAAAGERVKIFQGWGENKKTKVIAGEEYLFIKVQFPDREAKDETVAWVADRFIRPQSKCPYTNGNVIDIGTEQEITGIDDAKCCEFPTVKKTTHRFDSGMRRFSAGRSNGRLHAACDLYRYENEDVLAVAPGKVIRDLYYFYLGTYAIEVKHSGGFVVRYGEVTAHRASGVAKGKLMKMGQKIGKVGQVQLNVKPMLHFELYSGEKTGSLSLKPGTNKYNRRSDLMDPTDYLLKWEATSF